MTSAAPSAPGLPHGTTVSLGDDVWRYAGDTVLVGGAPTRILKLTRYATARLAGGSFEITDDASAGLAERLLDAGLAHPDPAVLPAVPLTDLTVIIPVHGRPAQLARLLDGLQGCCVLVVDDGTAEPAASLLRRTVAEAGAELVRLEINAGPASARNAGLRAATTPFVAFVDSDVVVTAGQLGTLLRHFADPRLVRDHVALLFAL